MTAYQPLCSRAAETASGSKNRARPLAPRRSARNPLNRLGKTRRCARIRVGAPILGNTIGNLAADRLSRTPKLAYADMGTDDSVAGGGTTGSTSGAGDGTQAQPVAGVAGGGRVGGGAHSDSQGSNASSTALVQPSGQDYILPRIQTPNSLLQLDIWENDIDALNGTYRAAHGGADYGDYAEIKANFVASRDALDTGIALANMDTSQLLFAGIGGPALVAAGAVAAPAVAGYFGSFYAGGTASTIASGGAGFLTGGTFGVGFEFSKNRAFGLQDTAGGYTAAFIGGGLGGTGLRLMPTRFLANPLGQAANRGLVGAFSGLSGEFSGQLVTAGGDLRQIDSGQLLLQAGIGGLTGAALPDVRWGGLTAGRNNSAAIYMGLQTRLSSGNISRFQLRYAGNAGAANAVKGLYAQAAGATADGIIKRVVGQ